MLRQRGLALSRLFSTACARAQTQKTRRPFPVLPPPRAPLPAASTSVREALDAHRALLELCRAGGGPRGIERHTKTNRKVLLRDRVAAVVDDPDDFFELGATAGVDLEYGDVPCAGFVAGIAAIRGVHCLVSGTDGTVKGGTVYPVTIAKTLRMQSIAAQLRIPCVTFVDSGGAFLPLQSEIFADAKMGGRGFRNQAVMSSEGIPQVALVCGLCTAGGAYTPTMSDEAIIVDVIGNIYLGGPPLVKAATGEIVTGEELGGATMHCSVSGITDHFAADEAESFEIVRDIISSLNITEPEFPSTGFEAPLSSPDHLEYISGLEQIAKDDCYSLLASLTDGSRFSEFKKNFGGNLITGFGFLKGMLTGWIINCGPITAADGQKGGHFVQLCDGRDIPLVFLQNGSNSAAAAAESCDAITLKERAKFVQCHSVARVPKVSVNVGGICGDELYTMCGPSFNPWFNFSWPLASMSKTAELPGRGISAGAVNSAQFWVSRCTIDGILLPGDTRDVIAKCLQLSMLNFERNRWVRGQGKTVLRM